MADWESQIAGERMAVDGEFNDRVAASSLTSQQWDLVMTAVSLEIENPTTPEDAELIADTSRLDSVLPELERVGDANPMAGGNARSSKGDGFLSGILSSLGVSGSSDEDLEAEAVELAEEYADRLQAKIVDRGRWTSVCERAASG